MGEMSLGTKAKTVSARHFFLKCEDRHMRFEDVEIVEILVYARLV